MSDKIPTQPYKGVRDFYPEDMAVQQYIFGIWADTAESFGYEQYDASVLEPANLYRAKGAVNEEIANEQTYTFTDRGEREVTLRPEMTPTVARMISARWRDIAKHSPVRWYSIPNLFRYERSQRGRLREHWQLNCDIFGTNSVAVDVEMIALAYQVFKNFGASDDMFNIHINNRATMNSAYAALGVTDEETIAAITRLNDKKDKIEDGEYLEKLTEVVGDAGLANSIKAMVETTDGGDNAVVQGLREIGIKNVILDRSLARGFDYYTGTIFEFKDTSPENNRALLGGGRYDNLTEMFGSEQVSGIGFGLGDVTMRDFLETHGLLPDNLEAAPDVLVIAMDEAQGMESLKIAQTIRDSGKNVTTYLGSKKVGDVIGSASERGVGFVLVVGEDEVRSQTLTLKNLESGEEKTGPITELFA